MSIDVYPPRGLLVPGTEQVTENLSVTVVNNTTGVVTFLEWVDGVSNAAHLHWRVPATYAGGLVTFTILRRGNPGVCISTIAAHRFRASGELQTILALTGFNATFTSGTGSVASSVTLPGTALQAGDNVRVDVVRDGANASDTISGSVAFDGAYMTYTAIVPRVFNAQPYEEGSFTVTATGFSGTAPSGIARYVRIGKQVTVLIPSGITGTSNATTFTLTGFLANIIPAVTHGFWAQFQDNAVIAVGTMQLSNTGILTIYKPDFSSFTASGTKALFGPVPITYLI